jgi:hypothetical protein
VQDVAAGGADGAPPEVLRSAGTAALEGPSRGPTCISRSSGAEFRDLHANTGSVETTCTPKQESI